MKFRNYIRIIDDEDVRDIPIYFNNKNYYISLKDFRYYLTKSSEHSEKINYRIDKAIEYIEKQDDLEYYGAVVKTKANIVLSILRGEDK